MECPNCGNNFPEEELQMGECSECDYKRRQMFTTVAVGTIVCILLFSVIILV